MPALQQIPEDEQHEEHVDLAVPHGGADRLHQRTHQDECTGRDSNRPIDLVPQAFEAQSDTEIEGDEDADHPDDPREFKRHRREGHEQDHRYRRIGVIHDAHEFGLVQAVTVEYRLRAFSIHRQVELVTEDPPVRGVDRDGQMLQIHREQAEREGHRDNNGRPRQHRAVCHCCALLRTDVRSGLDAQPGCAFLEHRPFSITE